MAAGGRMLQEVHNATNGKKRKGYGKVNKPRQRSVRLKEKEIRFSPDAGVRLTGTPHEKNQKEGGGQQLPKLV